MAKQKYKIGKKYLFIYNGEILLGKCSAVYLMGNGSGDKSKMVYGFNIYEPDGEWLDYMEEIPSKHISKSLEKLQKILKDAKENN